MTSKLIQIPSLGLVRFFQSMRARHVRITVKPDKTITVTIPRRGNLNEAMEFLHSKTSWIQMHLRKLDKYAHFRELPNIDIDVNKAKSDLFNRLDYFSKKYNFPYNRAVVRCQKSKWGSCTGKNNISLNINLARLPQELQDYVLIHELVHTIHKNHGRHFWAALNGLVGDARKFRKEIRRYRLIKDLTELNKKGR